MGGGDVAHGGGFVLPESESLKPIAAHLEGRGLVGLTTAGDTFVHRDGGDSWQAEDLSEGRAVTQLAFLVTIWSSGPRRKRSSTSSVGPPASRSHPRPSTS